MKTAFHTIRIFCIFVLLVACNQPLPKTELLFSEVQRIMATSPDSALARLSTISDAETTMLQKDYMFYIVLKVQAKCKTKRDVSSDTIIFRARRYFRKHNKEVSKNILAHFYSGRVYQERKEYEKAMQAYKDTQYEAAKTQNTAWQGMAQYNMGELFSIQNSYIKARENYTKAYALFKQSPYEKNGKQQTQCLCAIAQMFLLENQNRQAAQDSAMRYFRKGMDLANLSRDEALISFVAQNLSVAHKHLKQYDSARVYLKKSYSLNKDTTELPRYWLNFAILHDFTGQRDSTQVYVDKLKQYIDKSSNHSFKISVYNFLANWEMTNKRYHKAFYYQNRKFASIENSLSEKQTKEVYEVQQKYDFEQMQNRHNRKLIATGNWIIALLTICLATMAVVTILFRRVLKQKIKLLKMHVNMLCLKETAHDLHERQLFLQEREQDLKELLLWKFDVQQKTSLLKKELPQLSAQMNECRLIKRFEKIIYQGNVESEWEEILNTINALHPELAPFVKKTYPLLSETEFKVSLLSFSRLQAQEIAMLLNQSTHTINTARTNIRKKMGIKEKGGDIYLHLKTECKKIHP